MEALIKMKVFKINKISCFEACESELFSAALRAWKERKMKGKGEFRRSI